MVSENYWLKQYFSAWWVVVVRAPLHQHLPQTWSQARYILFSKARPGTYIYFQKSGQVHIYFQKPGQVHFILSQGTFHFKPGTYISFTSTYIFSKPSHFTLYSKPGTYIFSKVRPGAFYFEKSCQVHLISKFCWDEENRFHSKSFPHPDKSIFHLSALGHLY